MLILLFKFILKPNHLNKLALFAVLQPQGFTITECKLSKTFHFKQSIAISYCEKGDMFAVAVNVSMRTIAFYLAIYNEQAD